MHKQYMLGINVLGGADLTIPQHIDLIKQVGWDAFFTVWDHDRVEEWANTAARNGLIYQSIHSPFSHKHKVSYLWQNCEEGDFVADQLIECVRDCARFDIPVMVIHPFIGFRDHSPTQIGLDRYSRVIDVASKLGVTLGFENVEGEEYLAALMKTFWNEPCMGFCLDTGHEQCYNGGKDMMALYGEKLCHTHLNDNLGVLDKALPIDLSWKNDLHLMMGDGIVDWKGVMDRIDASPYRGPLMCELKLAHSVHDKHPTMAIDEFYALALNRARLLRERKL